MTTDIYNFNTCILDKIICFAIYMLSNFCGDQHTEAAIICIHCKCMLMSSIIFTRFHSQSKMANHLWTYSTRKSVFHKVCFHLFSELWFLSCCTTYGYINEIRWVEETLIHILPAELSHIQTSQVWLVNHKKPYHKGILCPVYGLLFLSRVVHHRCNH